MVDQVTDFLAWKRDEFLELISAPLDTLIKHNDDYFVMREPQLHLTFVETPTTPAELSKAKINVTIALRLVRADENYIYTKKSVDQFRREVKKILGINVNTITVEVNYASIPNATKADLDAFNAAFTSVMRPLTESDNQSCYDNFMHFATQRLVRSDIGFFKDTPDYMYSLATYMLASPFLLRMKPLSKSINLLGRDVFTKHAVDYFLSIYKDIENLATENFPKTNFRFANARHDLLMRDATGGDDYYPSQVNREKIHELLLSHNTLEYKIMMVDLFIAMLNKVHEHASFLIFLQDEFIASVHEIDDAERRVKALADKIPAEVVQRLFIHDFIGMKCEALSRITSSIDSLYEEVILIGAKTKSLAADVDSTRAYLIRIAGEMKEARPLQPVEEPKKKTHKEKSPDHDKSDVKGPENNSASSLLANFSFTTTCRTGPDNFNKEIRDRLRQMSLNTPAPITKPAEPINNNPSTPNRMVTFKLNNGEEHTLELKSLYSILPSMSKARYYICEHGLVELEEKERILLPSVQGRKLLRRDGHSANGLKMSIFEDAIGLKITKDDDRLVFMYIESTLAGENYRFYCPVIRLPHSDYENRFYKDTAENASFWELKARELHSRVIVSVSEHQSVSKAPQR